MPYLFTIPGAGGGGETVVNRRKIVEVAGILEWEAGEEDREEEEERRRRRRRRRSRRRRGRRSGKRGGANEPRTDDDDDDDDDNNSNNNNNNKKTDDKVGHHIVDFLTNWVVVGLTRRLRPSSSSSVDSSGDEDLRERILRLYSIVVSRDGLEGEVLGRFREMAFVAEEEEGGEGGKQRGKRGGRRRMLEDVCREVGEEVEGAEPGEASRRVTLAEATPWQKEEQPATTGKTSQAARAA